MYIEFNGKIDEKNYPEIIKFNNIAARIALFLTWLLFAVFIAIFWIGTKEPVCGIIFGLWTVAVWFMIIFPNLVCFPIKDEIALFPIKVTIEEEAIRRYGEKEDNYAGKEVIDVKKVIDKGNFYIILFYFPHKDVNFICQKDLIVEGTIEEFEEFFEGKIVRKIKKT